MVSIGAVILAAGMSKRMGQPKLLMKVNGKTLVHYPIMLATFHHLQPIVVIAGKYIEEMKKSLKVTQTVDFVFNHDYESGMASSLKLGIQTVEAKVDAVIVFLADQPFIPNEVVQSLMEQYMLHKEEGVKIVRPSYDGVLGHPILFDRSLFNEFKHINGDQGGRNIIQNYRQSMKIVSFHNRNWGMDIDTREEYEEVLSKFDER